MLYTHHQLNLITKSILKLMPAIALCSSTVAFAEPVTQPGELKNTYTEYEVGSATALDINSATNPTLNINGGLISAVDNAGIIKNSSGGAIDINNMEGIVNNTGVIQGEVYGIKVINGANIQINNTENATISGKENAFITETSFGLENRGSITSKESNVIQIDNGTATLKNFSTISSENASGVLVSGDGRATISNAGKIKGSDYAVKFESTKQNSLVLLEGSTLEGDVLSTNSKTNTLLLKDSGIEDSNFIGLNDDDGFASLDMVGKAWTLSGDIDLLGNDLDQIANDKALQVSSGILTLTGKVNNAGGTTINNGATLQLGDATHTAAFTSDAVINNGTLVFNQSGDSTFSSDINGTGHVVKSDASTLTLDGTFSYTGGTELNGGTTLIAKGSLLGTTAVPATITINNSATLASNGSLTGNIDIMAGGTLAAWNVATAGNTASSTADTVNGNVNNSGSLIVGSTATQPGQRFTINGDYAGTTGSKLIMNTTLADDNAATDRLTITGSTRGESKVALTNIGGQGAQTINGIEIISVGGSSDATFTLAAPATVGKWEYDLTKKNNDWFLVSEKKDDDNGGNNGGNNGGDNGGNNGGDNGGNNGGDNGGNNGGDNGGNNGGDNGGNNGGDNTPTPPKLPNPETGAYLGNYMAAQQMFIHKRDDREQLLARGTEEKNGWMYVRGRYHDNNVDDALGSYNTKTHVIQMGSDLLTRTSEQGEWHAGFMLGAGLSETHAQAASNKRSAKGHVSGYNVGLYATWQQDPELRLGSYIDSWVAANWYDSWVQGDRATREDYSSNGFAASIEAGHAWLLDSDTNRHWKVEPQGQIVYSYLKQNDHTENDKTRITAPDDDSYLTRLGVRFSNVDKTTPGAWQPWVSVNWLNGAGVNDLQFNDESAHDETPENRGQLEVGISGDLNKNMSISLRATGEWGENSYDAYGGHILWNYRW